MPRDTTVCQFCGVSYLIHHEIKMLEEQVAKLEQELEISRIAVEREQKLRDELEKNRSALSHLNIAFHEKEDALEQMSKEVENHQNIRNGLQLQLCKIQKDSEISEAAMRCFKENITKKLGDLLGAVKLFKSDLDTLRQDVQPALTQFAGVIQTTDLSIRQALVEYCAGFQNLTEDNLKLRRKIEALTTELHETVEKNSALKQIKADQMGHLQDQKNEAFSKMKCLESKVAELEKACLESSEAKNQLEMQNKVYQSQTVQIEDKLRKKQSEVQSMTVKLQKTEEMADATIQRLNRDCKQLEKDLASSHDELKRMKRLLQERDRKTEEINQTASLHSSHLDQVKIELDECKANVKALIEERELMVFSHQNQIKQLRESFKKKLETSDEIPAKALRSVEEKHREALAALEQRLKNDWKIELSVEQDKHAEAVRSVMERHKLQLKELETSMQEKVMTYKQQIPVLNQKISSLNETMTEKTMSFEEERESLKRLVAHLEEKLAQLLQEHDNSTSLNKLETSIVQKKADEALERNLSLEAQIESMREEISLLQDTVRRECEERFELTEALCQAKEQLKIDKVPNSTNALSSFKAPVSAVNKLDPQSISGSDLGHLSAPTMRSLSGVDGTVLAPRHNLPSLRSLPEIHSKKEMSHNSSPAKQSDATAQSSTSAHVKDISFGHDEVLRRSLSTGANDRKRLPDGSALSHRSSSLHQSRSADTVDTARKRIAAAIKRK